MSEIEGNSFIHYLVSFTGIGQEADSTQVAFRIADVLEDFGIDPLSSRSYNTTYAISPDRSTLKRVWRTMGEDRRKKIQELDPEFYAAVYLLAEVIQ